MYCTSYINMSCMYFMFYTTIYWQLYYPISTSVVCTSCFTQLYTVSCTILYHHDELYELHVLHNYILPVVLSYITMMSCMNLMFYSTIYCQLYYPISTSVVCTSCFTQLYTASCTILYQHELYVLHVLHNYILPVVLSNINISCMNFMFYTTIYCQLYYSLSTWVVCTSCFTQL